MARISTYVQDTTVNAHDRLIGTDGGQIGADGSIIAGTAGATKNFTLAEIRDFVHGVGTDSDVTIPHVPVFMRLDPTDPDSPGRYVDSHITQVGDDIIIGSTTDGADLIVHGDVMVGGDVLDMNGDPLFTQNPDGSVDISGVNELSYNVQVSDGSMVQSIEPYTVIAITQAGMYRLPEPTDGMWVKIVKIDGSGNSILLPHNGGTFRVMNQTLEDPNRMIVLNVREVSFEMVHIGNPTDASRVGWVFIGAN